MTLLEASAAQEVDSARRSPWAAAKFTGRSLPGGAVGQADVVQIGRAAVHDVAAVHLALVERHVAADDKIIALAG